MKNRFFNSKILKKIYCTFYAIAIWFSYILDAFQIPFCKYIITKHYKVSQGRNSNVIVMFDSISGMALCITGTHYIATSFNPFIC